MIAEAEEEVQRQSQLSSAINKVRIGFCGHFHNWIILQTLLSAR